MKLTHKKIADYIDLAAREFNVRPQEVTKKQLLALEGFPTKWELRKALEGSSLKAVQQRFFPITEKQLAENLETKEYNDQIKALETKLAKRQYFEAKLLESIEKNISPLSKIPQKKFKPSSTTQDRHLVVMLNDTHYGLLVHGDEVNGVNSFGWEQACRRSAMMLKETLNFKVHNRDQVNKVHLVLNGDLIQGIIHGLMYNQMEKSIFQVNGAIHILTHFINMLAQEFKEVEVHGLCGNHEDSPHKREHGKRVNAEKYDSYANMIFYALSAAFRNSPHIHFNVTKGIFLSMDLPGGRAAICHGDTLFARALGNPGTSINVKALSEEIRKFNEGEVSRGKAPIKLFLFGHVHNFAHFITSGGVEVYIAPSLSGTDGHSHGSYNANSNLIGQVVFESTPRFIMGDARLIRLQDADSNVELDELIPVFKNNLKWTK
jgi:hypothetical protein